MSKENSKEENEKKIIKKTSKTKKKFSYLEGKFLLVRVGDREKAATEDQIKEIESKLLELFEKNNVNCLTFVTHHAVDITIFENS